ncbi:MAG: NAD(P)-dependent oxidoreductase [Chthoniobacterales bacterium]
MKILITGASGFIGTNAVDAFAPLGWDILNYSRDAPLKSEQAPYWRGGDILDPVATAAAFREFQPNLVLHLAARADCDENTTVEEGYRVNTDGTRNVLDAIRATPSVERTIITSTQFVCGPGRLPERDEDYFPATVYGKSKVITETLTRTADLPCCWTIVRPTNIWGPWHLRYRREFWRVLQRGLYVHPGRQPVIRSYGYVKNVVDQMRRIFEAPADRVEGQTLYLGDRPANLLDWVNGFSRALVGREVRIVPRPFMRTLAALGDIPTRLTGRAFLINSSRYRSMISDYDTPMEATFALLGENPHSLEAGIDETVEWLRSYQGSGRTGGGA